MDTQTDMDNTCLPVSASALGFNLPVPEPVEEGQKARLVDLLPPNLSAEDKEKLFQGLIRQDSLLSVQEISRELAKTALDPATPVRQKLDINDQLIKLAGLDKKRDEVAQNTGGAYQLVINIGDTTTKITPPVIEVEDASV